MENQFILHTYLEFIDFISLFVFLNFTLDIKIDILKSHLL